MVGLVSMFVPAVAAAVVRRPWRDPAARVAAAWFVVGSGSVLALGQLVGAVPRSWPVSTGMVGLMPLLLLPPLLEWLHPAAARRPARTALAVALVVAIAWGGGVAALGTGRPFRLVAHPVMSLALAATAVAALAATVRRDARAGADGRLWILGALTTYFLVAVLLKPLLETLLRASPASLFDVHLGIQLVDAGCYLAIARGVAHRPHPAGTLAAAPAR